MIGMISTEKIYAASFSELNASTMFFKQNTTSTCTLASSAMMIRRAALLSGNGNWEGVTENALRSAAWVEGSGLRNSFSYAGIQISNEKISSNRTQTIMNLLYQHPEGIVIYDFEKPHAILLTDYTDGIFYCADPSSAAPSGRIPISQATITIESIDKYWYVSSPKFEIGADDSKLAEGCFFDEGTGKLTITEEFRWNEITKWGSLDWDKIEGLKPGEINTAEINLTGTKIFLDNEEKDCHINLDSDFTNLETVHFTGSIDARLEVDLSHLFGQCSQLKNIDFSGFSGVNVTDMSYMFIDCSTLANLDLSNFDTSNVTGMSCMFKGCSALTSLDLSNFDTSNVTDMGSMFEGCSALTSLDLSKFDTSNVTDMANIFGSCDSLVSLDLRNFDTSKVINMDGMFGGCDLLRSLDLSGFDTSSVENMATMFYFCSSLTSLDLSNFNTSSVNNMSHMFYECNSLRSLDLTSFDTSGVGTMSRMFYYCSSLRSLDLSNFDTSKVIYMSEMFYGCNSLTSLDLSKFNFKNIESDSENDLVRKMNNVEKIKIPADLPYAILLPDSSTIPDNMESYWVNTSGKECSEIQAGLSVPMTYSRRLRTVANPPATHLAKGKAFTDSKTNCKFKVTSSPAENPTVAFVGVTKKSKKVTIPSVVTYQGVACQVTSVSVKALKGNTKIKSLIIGSNINRIEKKAFEGCKNLKKITIESEKLNFVGKNALKGIHKKCRIKVPSSNLKAYQKFFRKKGQKPTVKITK